MRDTSGLCFAGLLLFLAAVALPLGSDRPLFWHLNGTAVALLTLVCLTKVEPGPRVFDLRPSMKVAVGLIFVAILWMMIQLLPIPSNYSPHLIWSEASQVLGQTIPARISVDPAATAAMILRYLTYLLVFLLVVRLSATRTGRDRLLFALFLTACAQAVIAIVSLAWGDRILLMEKWAYQGSATGTFVNRNSFATFLAFGLVIGTALMLGKSVGISGPDLGKERTRSTRRSRAELLWLFGFGQIVIGVALFLSGSRMGVVAATAGVAAVFFMFLVRPSGSRVRGLVLLTTFGAAGTACFFVAGAELVRRFGWLDYSANVRLSLFNQVLDMISAHPFTGYGGGAFEVAFPTFHQLSLSPEVTWDAAHNTYLELLTDLGIIGIAPMLAVAVVAVDILRTASTSKFAPALASSLGVVVVGAAHSAVDFPLQIQANTIVFVAAIACGYAESMNVRRASTVPAAPLQAADQGQETWTARIALRLHRPMILLVAVGTLLVSVLGVWREGATYFGEPVLEERIASIVQPRGGNIVNPLESSTSRRARLAACLETINEVKRAVDQSQLQLVELHQGCLRLVRELIAVAPTSSNEWLLAATLASNLGEIPDALSYLKMSYETGPNEQWIAFGRVPLAYHLRHRLDSESLASFAADLRLLLITPTGGARDCPYDPELCSVISEFARTPPSLRRNLLLKIINGS